MAKKPKFYAVRVGRARGIFSSWDQTKALVDGYKNAEHKSFPTLAAAKDWMGHEYAVKKPLGSEIKKQVISTPTGIYQSQLPNGIYNTTEPTIYIGTAQDQSRTVLSAYFGHDCDPRNIRGYLPGQYPISGELIGIWSALWSLRNSTPDEKLQLKYTVRTSSRYILNCIGPWGDIWESQLNRSDVLFREAEIVRKIRAELQCLKDRSINISIESGARGPLEDNKVWDSAVRLPLEYQDLLNLPKGSQDLEVHDGMDQLQRDTKYVYVNSTVLETGQAGYGVFFNDPRNVCNSVCDSTDQAGAELEGIHTALSLIEYTASPPESYTIVCRTSIFEAYLLDTKTASEDMEPIHHEIKLITERLITRGITIDIIEQSDLLGLPGSRMAESFARAAADGCQECMYFGTETDVD